MTLQIDVIPQILTDQIVALRRDEALPLQEMSLGRIDRLEVAAVNQTEAAIRTQGQDTLLSPQKVQGNALFHLRQANAIPR